MRDKGVQKWPQRNSTVGSGLYHQLRDTICRPFMMSQAKSYSFIFLLLVVVVCAFLTTRLVLDPTIPMDGNSIDRQVLTTRTIQMRPNGIHGIPTKPRRKVETPLNCSAPYQTGTCPRNYPKTFEPEEDPYRPTCPEYFRWIHEDLRPWALTGITRDALEQAKKTANFRLVIIDGRVYMEKFQDAFQTRDVFTMWGILQLLRKYPGKVPDLELMFDCVDWPVVKSADYSGPNAMAPPPLFRYCADDQTLDIVFPDWSFWGWAEVNIKPWQNLLKDLKEGNNRIKWMEREPYAYWKGNPVVAETRQDLFKCNASTNQDWNARLYAQDWIRESKEGYKQSDLANQCTHRYKIYIEGSAWSVSEKYILACDSMTLLVKPYYYDFFTRGLLPLHHYWPIKDNDKCRSIKYAVEWGNTHKRKAHEIGKAAGEFIQEELKMDNVYDYMFHLLNEYAKLLRFKPTVPRNAVELCAESMACPRNGTELKFMKDSLVKAPADTNPCTLPPPYSPASLHSFLRRKKNSISQVDSWEKKYWENKSQVQQ